MLDNDPTDTSATPEESSPGSSPEPTSTAPVVKRTTRKRVTKAAGTPAPVPAPTEHTDGAGTAEASATDPDPSTADDAAEGPAEPQKPAKKAARKAPAKKAAKKATAKKTAKKQADAEPADPDAPEILDPVGEPDASGPESGADESKPAATAVLFQTPEPTVVPPRKRASRKQAAAERVDAADAATGETEETDPTPGESAAQAAQAAEPAGDGAGAGGDATAASDADQGADTEQAKESDTDDDSTDEGSSRRRPRRRGGRRRRKGGGDDSGDDASDESGDKGSDKGSDNGSDKGSDKTDGGSDKDADDSDGGEGGSTSSRRRRSRRRRADDGDNDSSGGNGGGRGRRSRNPEDEITALSGSTRLEAKRQRRREGREAGRRRAPIVSEAEFLARRESVERVMVVRQRDDLTQIGVLEDEVLVEHYVARESQTSLIGNVYLGRVQNVLPSMEAAFIDIGRGRNAVLYAGEVNWTALGAKDGQPRKIESVLKSGQQILVQVSKDPIGHKGARLTSQVSLPGRFLVLVPDGTTSGISRKLPENERHRLKTLLKEIVPDSAGVIVRTAAEGASEEELTQDVERLTARWTDIDAKVKAGGGKGGAPQLLYGEPDLTLKVVRDLFTEDFTKLVVQGEGAWSLVDDYVAHVAPDLRERLERYEPGEHDGVDLFGSYRLDEQIAKGLDRKVWLPSGGSLVIDRTEAMTVVDVNTGKFTGSGGNLEETVTKNNLESAEEIVRQLRLRDIGGIVVIDFIDMVLESNRDLVLRRLVECLGRDRTRHQVAEVTSLGLVQMTRKRIGTGLLEAFSEDCEACRGRGLTIHDHPIEPSNRPDDGERRGGRRGRGGSNGGNGGNGGGDHGRGRSGSAPTPATHAPSPADIAAMPRHEPSEDTPVPEVDEVDTPVDGAAAVPEPTEPTPGAAEDPTAEPRAGETDAATDAGTDAGTGTAVVNEEPAPAATAPAAEPEAAQPTDPEPAQQEPARPTPSEPSEPAEVPPSVPVESGPAVVTSSRRRSARRAAGPPVALPEAQGDPHGSTSPDSGAASPTGSGPADPEPGAGPATSAEDGADADPEVDDGGFVLHVPIKRRGARKR